HPQSAYSAGRGADGEEHRNATAHRRTSCADRRIDKAVGAAVHAAPARHAAGVLSETAAGACPALAAADQHARYFDRPGLRLWFGGTAVTRLQGAFRPHAAPG